ncbi:LamG domain-containing protein [Nonomuraea sp. NPDC049695]|uniref:LamG domain-containing protein n=1 Tax=Nonomuraea sp. NPDC049695 TaxID=3154734 RepID=UPI003439B124
MDLTRLASGVLSLATVAAIIALPAEPLPARASTTVPTTVPTAAAAPAEASEEEAAAKAARLGAPVEVAALRGERTDVFATPDGSLEAREYLRPIRTRISGTWTPIDTTLATTGDGMVAPKAATVGLGFSGGGDKPLVRITQAGRTLALSWPGPLPAPRLEGDTATYPDVLPGVDLRMKAQEDGYSQVLVVKSAAAAADARLAGLRLGLAADGMTVKETEAGGLSVTDNGSGGVVFEAAQPLMWDSSGGSGQTLRTAGEPGPGQTGKLAAVDVDVPAGGGELTLKPDLGVLRGQDTVYPVFIDPQVYTPKATAWTMASKYWANSPQWRFNEKSDEGLGYCGWAYCKPYDTKRLFYRLPTSKFAGKTILEAEFVVRNIWSASCTEKREVQVWRTKNISSSTTWKVQEPSSFWLDKLDADTFAHGYDGCAAKDAEFDVKPAVQLAAKNNWSTLTFGMQATDEEDPYGWKRFTDDAYLRVRYNRPPPQLKMSQLSMEYGGICKRPPDAPYVRTLGKIHANHVTDPDGDRIRLEFKAEWEGGSWAPKDRLTPAKASGSEFSIPLPSTLPKNVPIHWFARVYDGARYSPWSHEGSPTSCYFTYDPTAPPAPTVTSPEYPAFDSEDPNAPWYDGMGQYGRFTLKSGDDGVVKYWWGLNVDASSDHAVATTDGADKTIKLLPARIGLNTLYVRSFDAAGNASAPYSYRFRVRSGQQERAAWQLDENAGATQAASGGAEWPAALQGGLTPGGEGVAGAGGLHLDGVDDHAVTEAPALDTAKSFSVSLWARLPAGRAPTAVTAISQAGVNTSGFELTYLGDRWTFMTHASDVAAAAEVKAAQPPCPSGDTACAASRLGTWTHLVGVFDNAEQQLRLYVNGVLAGQAIHDRPWDARGRTVLGAAGMRNDWIRNFFAGDLDEIQLFDYQLPGDQIQRLAARQPVSTNRPAELVWNLDESADQAHVTGRPQQAGAALRGGARAGVLGVSGQALELDGTDDYAAAGRPMVDTAQSFTVSAWAWLPPDKAARNMSVIGQAGVNHRGFELYHSSASGWVFMRADSDSSAATPIRAVQDPCGDGTVKCVGAGLGEWSHLVGVYDKDAAVIQLYVNGKLRATRPFTTPWYAGGELTMGAAGPVGGSAAPVSFLRGRLDDLRLYDRVLSAGEVGQLFRQLPVVTARWKLMTATGTVTRDDTEPRNDLTLMNGATVAPGFIDGQLTLNGSNQYAVTAATPVDTSGSFTVALWAKASSFPEEQSTVLTVPGAKQSAITVRYLPPPPPADPDDPDEPPTDPGRWQVTMADADTDGALVAEAEHGQFYGPTDPTHLAVVYDAFANELTLYVDGEAQGVGCADDDDDGEQDDPACEPRISWTDNTRAFKATQPMQLGRSRTGASTWGEYWYGVISDVWAFQGALTELQIAHLAVGQPGIPSQVPGS